MASRYWVGGTASWDGTAGTKWSATSGGAGGATVPTIADDVFFNASSGAGTVTIAAGAPGAKSINCTGFTGTLTGSANITVAGSITLVTGMTYTHTGIVFITGTSTLITAAKTFSPLTINGAGITVTLGSALNVGSSDITLLAGTFTTSASNYSITAGSVILNGTNTRSVLLNGSTVTLSGLFPWQCNGTTGLTFTRGTSTINLTNGNCSFEGAGLTYYNVSFSGTANSSFPSVTGANTFNQFSVTASTSDIKAFTFDSDQTITTMVCSGASVIRRIWLKSTFKGFTRTLTISTWSSITDVDFQDISLNSSRSGTRLGNCGGNTNITFSASKTVYWNLAGSQSWTATGWATSSGGTPSANNFPLAHDTAVFDDTGSAGTITVSQRHPLPAIDMSARTSAMTLSFTASLNYVFGNWTNGSGTTLNFNNNDLWLEKAGTQVITSAGIAFTSLDNFYLNADTTQFADAFTSSTSSMLCTGNPSKTIDLNSKTITTYIFNNTCPNLTFTFGASGILNITGVGAAFNTGDLIAVSGSRTVRMTYSGATSTSAQQTASTQSTALDIYFTAGTYSGALAISSNFRNVDYTGFSGTQSAGNKNIYGSFLASTGMSFAGGSGTITFASTATGNTIETKGKTIDQAFSFDGVGGSWSLVDNLTGGSTRTLTLTNGTLNLNGFTFSIGLVATDTGTKNLTFNGGTLNVTGSGTTAFNNAQPTNFTTTAGTGTGKIQMSSSSAKTFVGGGSTYNCTLDQAGAGVLTISGTNTFNDISNSRNTVGASTITFAGNQTVVNFTATGVSGRVLTINSNVAFTQRTLTKSGGGTVSVNYMSIRDSNATGGSWYAGANSTNVSNNSGWIFTAPPVGGTSNFFLMFM